jgi:hypothetical protein
MAITIPMPIRHAADRCVYTKRHKITQILKLRNISLFQDLDGFVSVFVDTCAGRVSYRHESLSEKLTYLKNLKNTILVCTEMIQGCQ